MEKALFLRAKKNISYKINPQTHLDKNQSLCIRDLTDVAYLMKMRICIDQYIDNREMVMNAIRARLISIGFKPYRYFNFLL